MRQKFFERLGEPKFIGVAEFARRAGLSTSRVRLMLKRRDLRGYWYLRGKGLGYAILESDACEWLDRNRSNVIPFKRKTSR